MLSIITIVIIALTRRVWPLLQSSLLQILPLIGLWLFLVLHKSSTQKPCWLPVDSAVRLAFSGCRQNLGNGHQMSPRPLRVRHHLLLSKPILHFGAPLPRWLSVIPICQPQPFALPLSPKVYRAIALLLAVKSQPPSQHLRLVYIYRERRDDCQTCFFIAGQWKK